MIFVAKASWFFIVMEYEDAVRGRGCISGVVVNNGRRWL